MRKKKQKPKTTFTNKDVKIITKEAVSGLLLIMICLLMDKHKFTYDKMDAFLQDVFRNAENMDKKLLKRDDVIQLINKYSNVEG